MNGNDAGADADTFDVVLPRTLNASATEAWKAWGDQEYVTRRWGPTGFTSPSAGMDFRVGGSSLARMRVPAEYGGGEMYHTWTYTDTVLHERIEFVSNFADEEGNHLDPAAIGISRASRKASRARSLSRLRATARQRSPSRSAAT